MVLDVYRKNLEALLSPLSRAFSHIHPDSFTALSLVFAMIAGAFYAFSGSWVPGGRYPWLLLFALLFISLSSITDLLDGSVARLTGRTTAKGDFLDHSFDRFSDIAILTGIALSPYCNEIFGLVCVIFVLLSSYMGTQAQAVGCRRNYSGVMGRADRMVLLLCATPLQFFMQMGWGVKGPDIGIGRPIMPLEILMVVMLIGGILTTLKRGIDTYMELREGEGDRRVGPGIAFGRRKRR